MIRSSAMTAGCSRLAVSSRFRKRWSSGRQHDCAGQKATPLPHRMPADPTRVLVVEWTVCAAGDAVRLYRVNGGGHHVPSVTPLPDEDWAKQTGRQNQDIETIKEFWTFAKMFSH